MSSKVHTEIVLDPTQLPAASPQQLDDFKRYIGSKSCYHAGPLDRARVHSVQAKVAYQCTMEILLEARELLWTRKPSKQRLNHSAPPAFDIWTDYQFQLPSASDKRSEQKRSLPERAYTTDCDACQGRGNTDCTNQTCINGAEKCLACNQGRRSDGTPCSLCKNGLITCKTCSGKARLPCSKCDSCGGFLHSATLHARWDTRTSTWFYQNSFLPEERIGQVKKASMWSKSEMPWTKESSIETFVLTIDETPYPGVPLKMNIVRDYNEKHLGETVKLKKQMRKLECSIERLDFEEVEYSLEPKYLNQKDPSRGNHFRFCRYADAEGRRLIYENDYPLNSCGCLGGCCACYNCSCAIL